MNKQQPFLETERENTDNSLSAERDKTNESLIVGRAKSEDHTDKVVNAERLLADRRTTSTRIETDEARRKKSGSSSASGKATRDAQQLTDERLCADKITEHERTRTDAALIKERKIKDALVNQFLAQERKRTDDNLSVERTRTDSEVNVNSTLLSDEITEHSRTKTRLTSRDEFLAIVSHDLRNPIGAASSCAGLLLEDASYSDLNPEVRAMIALIKRNSDTALRLIGDLLDMEQVAEGKLQVNFAAHDAGKIIQESLDSHLQLASEKKIRLGFTPADFSGEVICDRDRVSQVISNLVGNAIKFTPISGSVTVEAALSEMDLQVSVRDTGPGIPDQMKNEIFERFVQLASNDRTGLGLGLHIAKMLVEAHRGRIWVETKPGQGSTFKFSLPRH